MYLLRRQEEREGRRKGGRLERVEVEEERRFNWHYYDEEGKEGENA